MQARRAPTWTHPTVYCVTRGRRVRPPICSTAISWITGVQVLPQARQAQHTQRHRFHPRHRPHTGDHSGRSWCLRNWTVQGAHLSQPQALILTLALSLSSHECRCRPVGSGGCCFPCLPFSRPSCLNDQLLRGSLSLLRLCKPKRYDALFPRSSATTEALIRLMLPCSVYGHAGKRQERWWQGGVLWRRRICSVVVQLQLGTA